MLQVELSIIPVPPELWNFPECGTYSDKIGLVRVIAEMVDHPAVTCQMGGKGNADEIWTLTHLDTLTKKEASTCEIFLLAMDF